MITPVNFSLPGLLQGFIIFFEANYRYCLKTLSWIYNISCKSFDTFYGFYWAKLPLLNVVSHWGCVRTLSPISLTSKIIKIIIFHPRGWWLKLSYCLSFVVVTMASNINFCRNRKNYLRADRIFNCWFLIGKLCIFSYFQYLMEIYFYKG